jgi:hypothetical protein
VIPHQSFNTRNFYTRQTAAALEPNRVEPKLRDPIIPLNMNMLRLVTIASVEKESIRA